MKAEKFSINSLKDVEVHFEDLSVLIKGIMSDLDEQSGKNDALQVAIGFLIANTPPLSKAKYNQFKAALEIASENAGDYDLNNLPSDLHDVVDNLPDHMWDSLESYSNDVYTARKRGFESASEFINQVLNNTRRRPVLAFCTRHLTALLVGIVVLIFIVS